MLLENEKGEPREAESARRSPTTSVSTRECESLQSAQTRAESAGSRACARTRIASQAGPNTIATSLAIVVYEDLNNLAFDDKNEVPKPFKLDYRKLKTDKRAVIKHKLEGGDGNFGANG